MSMIAKVLIIIIIKCLFNGKHKKQLSFGNNRPTPATPHGGYNR